MKKHQKLVCGMLAILTSGLVPSCSQCDALTAAAATTGVVALLPGVDDKTRTAAAIATPVLGFFAYNCYRANERQKREAEAKAKRIQKVYVSKGGSSSGMSRYRAVPVTRDNSVHRKFEVDKKVSTREVMIIDAEKGTVADPAVYEIDRSKKAIEANGKNITVDV